MHSAIYMDDKISHQLYSIHYEGPMMTQLLSLSQ